tara:strand:- start:1343 stop:1642 length:300 start_codon:yes stop_codon:yes gene_type:complete
MSDDLIFMEYFIDINNMTVAEVKELLKHQDLPVSGKKEDLVLRLVAYSPRPQGLGLTTTFIHSPEVIRSSVMDKVNKILNPPFRNKVINWQSFPTELFT